MRSKPQNVMVMRDIACAGYVAGGNVRWFAKDAEGAGYTAETARDNLVSRLSFDDDVSDRYASMLAFPAFEGQFQSGQLDTVMSITGRLLPWEVTGASSLTHDSFPGGESMFQYYKPILNLAQVHYGEVRARAHSHALTHTPAGRLTFHCALAACAQDMKAAENMDFISQGSTNNALCFLGPHRRFDPFTQSFMCARRSIEPPAAG